MKNGQHHGIGGRVIKWKGRVASIAPALASVSVVALMAGGAVGQTVIDTAVTGKQIITIDEDVTITKDGSISLKDALYDTAPLYIDVAEFSSIVTNDGSLDLNQESRENSGAGIWLEGNLAGGAILNNGDITVEILNEVTFNTVNGVYVRGDVTGTVTNSSTGVIEVLAEAGSTSASAYGILVDGAVGGSGVISNAGVINVEANNLDTDSAKAFGVYVAVGLDGVIENSGMINAQTSGGSGNATTMGIFVGNAISGSITNTMTGRIDVQADSSSEYASASGVNVAGAVQDGAVIENAGTIDVEADAESGAIAYGIRSGGSLFGTITNTVSGLIDVDADARRNEVNAYGILVSESVQDGAAIENAGSIIVLANSQDDADAYGIYVGEDLYGSITNTISGLIDVEANSGTDEPSAYGVLVAGSVQDGAAIVNDGRIEVAALVGTESSTAYAAGIHIGSDMSGTIVNSGTIDVYAESGTSEATAYGIRVVGTAVGALTNSGDILVEAFSTTDSAGAYGIAVGILDGTITNSGLIDVDALANSDDATTYGIYVDETLNGTITNTADGVITAFASSTGSSAYAYGVHASVIGSEGSIVNAGRIEATATASSGTDSVSAYGIYVSTVLVDGTVTNSGDILVHAESGEASAYASGVFLTNMAGTFTNTGRIVARKGDTVGTAILINGTGGNVMLDTGGFIEGAIVLNGPLDVNVQGDSGRSVHWTADTSGDVAFDVDDAGTAGTTVFLREGSGSAEFATMDGSGFAGVRQAAGDAGFIGLDPLLSQTRGAAVSPVQVTNGNVDGGTFVPYVAAAAKSMSYGDDNRMLDQDITTSSLSFGGTMALQNGMTFGLGAGVMSGTVEVDDFDQSSFDTDQKGAFIGAALGRNLGNLNFGGALSIGRQQYDSTRFVNDNTVVGGLVRQDASFDSSFVALALGVSGRFDIGNGMMLVPNGSLRYAKHRVDAYGETGSDGAAQVAGQDFGVFESEIGVALETAVGNGILSGGVSLLSRNVTGDKDVLVTMIGDTEFVDTSIGSSSAAKLSVGYSTNFSSSGQFNVGIETLVGSDGLSGEKISGELRIAF